MDSLYLSKGHSHLLSSTPVQSSEDSGYFGSGHRRLKSNGNVLSSCSPITESSLKNIYDSSSLQHEFHFISPPCKLDKNLHANFVKNELLSSSEINELSELESISSDFSDQNELCNTYPSVSKVQQKSFGIHYSSNHVRNAGFDYAPFSEYKDIKYKLFESETSDFSNADDCQYSNVLNEPFQRECITNQTKIDFFQELKIRNCSLIISNITCYLSAKELCIASCVSKEWNKIILSDRKANLRKNNFITERFNFLNGPSKENRLGVKFGPARGHKKAFLNLTNVYSTVNLPGKSKVINTKFDSFIREAKNEQKLSKCPRCCYPAKFLDASKCVCTRCSYSFCYHCLNPLLKNHTCYKVQIPNIAVGSRRSKKNLKRL